MKNYLYTHWADSTLLLAIAITTVLLSYFSVTPWPLFLIWMQFPVYLVHQFEEHVYPGNFKAFINSVIFKSKKDNYPLNSADVFWINILAIWFLFPVGAVLAQNVSLGYGVLLPIFGLFNASLHILFFLIKKRYNPGLLVSILVNYPTGIYTLMVLTQNHITTTWNVSVAFLITLVSHAGIIIFAKMKMAK